MEVILPSFASLFTPTPSSFSVKPSKNPSQISPPFVPFPLKIPPPQNLSAFITLSSSSFTNSSRSFSSKTTRVLVSAAAATTTTTSLPSISAGCDNTSPQRHWMVLMQEPSPELNSKEEIIDYYVKNLERVVGSEKDAQMCIYDACCTRNNYGFCCDIDQDAADELARLPGVLSVRPDLDLGSVQKDYGLSDCGVELNPPSSLYSRSPLLFTPGASKRWIVRVEKPLGVLITKKQVVDYYVRVLTKVMGNENDAQMCIYHVSLQSNYGFCCELDDACAQELAGVPSVLSVRLDENFESNDKDYGGEKLENSGPQDSSSPSQVTNIKTKKLFVTGLSFYTSEKTLRAAFEGFGELVEVKIIMDKISKRSKGYAFIEYTTEEAAATALEEMNGKIINGWMITVDVAKKNPPKYSRGRPRPAT
ncbi:organelle RRM domain-containing protein 1, chloroplastic isoform X1 [Coffea arabica]|uniref:Organelle RRM domain-containing protein 1, chloroplastic isoform X1 n=2 Tax=Coffea arabica TaxID=13443 RepID=A0A6P6VS63_COFAR|nr:organelle RRM domain-containing protein 1, chloroplastic-like isoform X1 [Coffea arabica]